MMHTEEELTIVKILIHKGMNKHEVMGTMAILKKENLFSKMLKILQDHKELTKSDIIQLTSINGQRKLDNGISL